MERLPCDAHIHRRSTSAPHPMSTAMTPVQKEAKERRR
jgi:hypothetical protein